MPSSPQVLDLFPTQVCLVDLPEAESTRPALLQSILEERARTPGFEVSQVGGWHSLPDLAQRPDPYRSAMQAIVNAVATRMRALAQQRRIELPPFRWSVQAWAIVLEPGGYNRVHDHVDAHWSVAWYVDAGDARTELGGSLCLLDPRRGSTAIPGLDLDPTVLDVQPRTGMLAIFPGYLQHMVHPYDGTRPRVCLSANLSVHLTEGPG